MQHCLAMHRQMYTVFLEPNDRTETKANGAAVWALMAESLASLV